MSKLRRAVSNTEGAVMVEFMAVFFPLFAFFLGLLQLLFIHAANLVNNHAAQSAARAAAVVLSDPLGGGGVAEVARAARIPLSTLGLNRSDVNVNVNPASPSRNQMITVTVTIDYPCRVPLGNLIACGGATTTLSAQARMPNQGVQYIF